MKAKITVEFEIELAPPEYYPKGLTTEGMIQFEVNNFYEDPDMLFYFLSPGSYKVTGELKGK